MNTLRFFILGLSVFGFLSCTSENSLTVEVNVTNNLDMARKSETIEIATSALSSLLVNHSADQLIVKDAKTNKALLSQLIDLDGDKNQIN